MLSLSLFAARRVLAPWLGAGLFVLFFLAARGSEPLVASDAAALAAVRALTRADTWSVLVAAAPLIFYRAAQLGTPQANRWLAPTPAPPLARAAALVLGCAPACAALTLLAALVGEASLAGGGAAWTRVETLASPRAVLLDEAPSVRWRVRPLAAGERLRLWTSIAIGSGPAVTARFEARAGAASASVEARLSGRTALEFAPPSGAELELELTRLDHGALLVLPPDGLEVLAPRASERAAALALGLHAFWLLAAGSALALGLARWLRPGLAAGVVMSLVLFACVRDDGGPFGALRRAFEELAQGLVPAAPPRAAWGVALLLVALGIVLQGLGRRRA
jgi:hypothetical protein